MALISLQIKYYTDIFRFINIAGYSNSIKHAKAYGDIVILDMYPNFED